jgi:DNA-binding NarL/FixJ family response regulator
VTARAESRAGALPQRTATIRSARAAVLLADGEGAGALEAAEEAVRLADSADNPLLSGRCRIQYGNALAASGQREQGVSELRRAEQVLSECGATREAAAAAQDLRRLGERVRRRARPDRGAGLSGLSSREREVADEVAAGKTNRDIAATLFLSEKTIESHLARIYSKLDVHSRAALTAIVARQGAPAAAGDSSPNAPMP